jgi:hypothetical protein
MTDEPGVYQAQDKSATWEPMQHLSPQKPNEAVGTVATGLHTGKARYVSALLTLLTCLF